VAFKPTECKQKAHTNMDTETWLNLLLFVRHLSRTYKEEIYLAGTQASLKRKRIWKNCNIWIG
jgi:hypothetical protein